MSVKQTTSRRRVAASHGEAVKANVPASRFVAAFLEGVTQLEAARSAFDGARVTQLDILRKSIVGVPAVSEADWDRTWKEPVRAALLASGRYQEKSLPPKVAALGVVVMGLTNGIEPREGDTLKLYEDYARQQLAKRGLREVKAQGTKRQSPEAKEAKAAKAAQADYMGAVERVTLGNASFAADLALCMANPDSREELRRLVAEIAEEERAKDREEAKASRRRK